MGFFGDLLKIGGTILGGPLGGLAGGVVASAFGNNKPKASKSGTTDLMSLFYPAAEQQAGFELKNIGKRFSATDKAYSLLTGGNDAQLYRRFQGMPDYSGQRNARMLAERGYGSGVADSALLDAANKKTAAGNSFLAAMLSPENQASRQMQAANLYGGDPVARYLAAQGASNSQRTADAQYNASKPPTFLETLLGIAPDVLPYFLPAKKAKT